MAQNLNVEWYRTFAAAARSTFQCYCVIYDDRKRASAQTSLGHFFQKAGRTEPTKNQNLCQQCQVWVERRLAHRLLLVMTLQLYHLLPLLHPPVSNSSCLFTWCQPLYAGCCTGPLSFSRDCKIKNVFFIFCVCLLCIICVKIITNLL